MGEPVRFFDHLPLGFLSRLQHASSLLANLPLFVFTYNNHITFRWQPSLKMFGKKLAN